MPAQQLGNYVQTTLAAGCTNVATVLTLTSVAGWPIIGNFRLRIDDASPATTFEIVEVTSVNVGATQVTVTRGLEGTTAIAHSAGAFVGNDLTAAMLVLAFPLGLVPSGYAEASAIQTPITTLVDLTSLTVTCTPVAAGRLWKITAFCAFQSTVANDYVNLHVVESAADIASPIWDLGIANAQVQNLAIVRVAPSLAAHTYKLQASRIVGTGTLSLQASATNKAFLMVEDIGSA